MLAGLLGDEPEAWGLAALITLSLARAAGRGEVYVPLDEQDAAAWDARLIADGEACLRRASRPGPPGRFRAGGGDPGSALRPAAHRRHRLAGATHPLRRPGHCRAEPGQPGRAGHGDRPHRRAGGRPCRARDPGRRRLPAVPGRSRRPARSYRPAPRTPSARRPPPRPTRPRENIWNAAPEGVDRPGACSSWWHDDHRIRKHHPGRRHAGPRPCRRGHPRRVHPRRLGRRATRTRCPWASPRRAWRRAGRCCSAAAPTRTC